jgi:hypothetical protein
MVAIVHLVTLGWITCSILGTAYIVWPLALRAELPARRMDYAAYVFTLVGLIGMVAHFWIQEYGGMAWSAATAACGVLYVAGRMARAVRRAAIQPGVKLHIMLACANIGVAASAGVLIGWDKVAHFLPGFVLANVFAHAHLAAIGWATMMVVGVGYRLLPMTVPSKMPASTASGAILMECGVLGLFITLIMRSALAIVFALAIVVALLMFLTHVVGMMRVPVSPPAGATRPNFGMLHTAAAAVWLCAAMAIGVKLLVVPSSPRTLHAAAAYGVFGLVGFLAQMVVAMEARLIPLATWFWGTDRDPNTPPLSPHRMRDRTLQAIVFVAWSSGVPLVATGMFVESARLVGAGAWVLFAGVAIGSLDTLLVVTHAIGRASAATGVSRAGSWARGDALRSR